MNFKKLVCLFLLASTSSLAGTCELLATRSYQFYDNPSQPNVTLKLGPSFQGNISYHNQSASVTTKCDNNLISLSWKSPQMEGYIKGYMTLGGLGGLVVIETLEGNMDGSPLPFTSLKTRAIGGGGGI